MMLQGTPIKSCADFSASQSHLEAAYHVVKKGYKTIPSQKEPVGELKGVENPEKVQIYCWNPSPAVSFEP
jgi:hypothetical protein